jgi:hypothetical protein
MRFEVRYLFYKFSPGPAVYLDAGKGQVVYRGKQVTFLRRRPEPYNRGLAADPV